MSDVVTLDRRVFQRILAVLEAVEPLVLEQKTKWVDSREAMRILGVGKTKLWSLQAEGAIKVTNTGKGRNVKYCRKSLEHYLEQNSNK